MSIALLSIIALAIAIVIGVYKRVNMGVIALGLTFIMGQWMFNVKDYKLGSVKDLYVKGWPIGIFFMMMAAMLMFSFANANGTIKLLAEKIAYAASGKAKLLPWAFFFATFGMTALGSDPSVAAFILPIAMMAGAKANISPVMLSIMTIGGALSGGTSPLCVVGIVTSGLAAKEGVTNYIPIWMATLTTVWLEAIIVYFVFGGLKIKTIDSLGLEKPVKFNSKQIQTLVVIGAALSTVIFLKMDLAMSAFIASAIMLMLGLADEKEAFKSVSWNVLVLVGGVGVLVFTMQTVGGIKMIADFLSSIMNKYTAVPLMSMIGAIMSFVTSATGVVMPTLFPTLGDLSKSMQGVISPIEFMQGIQAGAMGATPYSPLSALGAMAMATLPAHIDKEKHFSKMLLVAVCNIVYVALLSATGIYKLFIF